MPDYLAALRQRRTLFAADVEKMRGSPARQRLEQFGAIAAAETVLRNITDQIATFERLRVLSEATDRGPYPESQIQKSFEAFVESWAKVEEIIEVAEMQMKTMNDDGGGGAGPPKTPRRPI
jgi:hypothetical protein